MSDTVIRVENISKLYRLGEIGTGTLRHDINRWWYRVRGKEDPYLAIGQENDRTVSGQSDYVWALKDINFDVKRGEVLGIIGRNGAGKSTLLKILSRVTAPTAGEIKIKGRIASLLEVGTGFNPDLTGRDNIYLNGAILGMRKREIDRKFDEIVAFAEVERYIDTPVKRYSSGMYVRLAFAVAAHLEPDILIVDEVLAVGDAEFQKKCLGKMESVAGKEGRTILFVSHQIAAVTRLCQNVLWLNSGRIKNYGRSGPICSEYLANGSSTSSRRVWTPQERAPGDEWVRLQSVEVLADGSPAENIDITSPVEVQVNYQVLKAGKVLIPNLHFYSDDGTLIFISHDWYSGWRERAKPPGHYRTAFTIPGNFFSEGRVNVKVAIGTYRPFEVHFEEADVVAFTVVENAGGETSRGDYAGHLPGVVRPLIASKTEVLNA